ncbi:lipopolysaccharide-induced tumor necrosis factor-alpha factor homolog [Lucilia sericata]|uniref:lipopolysaccharide-induced tumor necrosis factor-alpha factor homolog n=1 Tax=Lucilia sericata TaxID=13632 RepID=UPI0018A7FA0A|nr:lipopolysaccharide-induced tumor necrosis factor-alpha factor homolog [Lucilia sericata]
MDTKNPYRPVENKLQNVQQQQHIDMEQVNNGPPPMYNNNFAQPSASAPAAGPPSTATTVQIMANQPMFPQPVGPKSMQMTCPSCRCRIETEVRHRSTSKTHFACLLLSWTICCCCIPYCMDSCRNANHFCPMCGAYIGTYAS